MIALVEIIHIMGATAANVHWAITESVSLSASDGTPKKIPPFHLSELVFFKYKNKEWLIY